MAEKILLCSVFAQVALSFYLMFIMGFARMGAIKRRDVKAKDVSLRKADLPEYAARASNSYHNQFEMPVLFYALVALVLITKQADYIIAGFAAAYVASRIVHAIIHTASTNFKLRRQVFILTAFILMGAWGVYAFRILTM